MTEAVVGEKLRISQTRSVGQTTIGPLYAALDLGTNNCRLLLARPTGTGFRVIEAFSRITRLGEGLSASGLLSEPAIERTIAALKICAQRLDRHGAGRLRAVATEACRQATNCQDFLTRVDEETGIALEIIPAEEEARLALAGCASLLNRRLPQALVFDIGGGSTELITVSMASPEDDEVVETVWSLPIGVVSMAERYGEELHHPAGYARVVNHVVTLLAPFDPDGSLGRRAAAGQLQLLGTSGTVTTLAGVHLNLSRYDRSLVDGLVMEFTDIVSVTRRLTEASGAERAAHPCIGQERADLVVAGCAILDAICRLWPVGALSVADRGVREGMLLSMMRADRILAES